MNFIPLEYLWLGTTKALNHSLRKEIQRMALTPRERADIAQLAYVQSMEDQRERAESGEDGFGDGSCDHMMTRYQNLAIVHIEGALVPGNANYYSLCDKSEVGYSNIRNALIEAAHDERTTGIVLDMDTPGGAASGIMEVSDLIKQIDCTMKPVYTYTGSNMCSGGYWLGCTGRSIYANPMSSVGSIGVIMTHMSCKRMYEEQGIDVSVIRSGKYKALGNSFEALDEASEMVLQTECNQMYDMFLGHVSEHRGLTTQDLKIESAEGRVFLAKDAVSIGLVDKIMSFDQALEEISGQCGASTLYANSQKQDNNTMSVNSMAKGTKTLSKKDQAAIACGAPVDQIQGTEPEPVEPVAEVAEVVEVAAVEPVAAVESPAQGLDVMALINSLSAANVEISELKRDKLALEERNASVESTRTGLRHIAIEAIQRLQVACGHSATALDDASDGALLETYNKTFTTFQTRFPVGAQAVVPTSADTVNDHSAGMAITKGMTL